MKTENEIIKLVEHALNEYFGYKGDLDNSLRDTPLTSPPFCLTGSDLYRLLMLIEKKYFIDITFDNVKKYGFKTINEIVTLVKYELSFC